MISTFVYSRECSIFSLLPLPTLTNQTLYQNSDYIPTSWSEVSINIPKLSAIPFCEFPYLFN